MQIKEKFCDIVNELKNDSNKMFEWLIIFVMYAYPVFFFIGLLIGKYYFLQEFPLLLVFIISAIHFILKLKRGDKFNLNIIDICCVLMMICIILSTIFTKDMHQTLYGYAFDAEPFTHLIAYYMLVIIVSRLTSKSKKHILNCFVLLAYIEMVVALIQHTGVWQFECDNRSKYALSKGIAVGLTINQNHFAVITVIIYAAMIAIFMVLERKDKKRTSF